jgi:superoxide dismutase, Fe-Mn family
MDRRDFNKAALLAGTALILPQAQKAFAQNDDYKKNFQFKPLPYSYDALEPYIDKMTMEIHYSKHHRAYYDNFLNLIKGTDAEKQSVLDTFKNISKFPAGIRNNAGGYWNHTMFWDIMTAKGGGEPSGKLADAIKNDFGSFSEFKKKFSEAAKTRFGSGWAWLCKDSSGKLFLSSTPNQDNPLMDIVDKKGTPLLLLDVWEHAYYLKYQNRRAEYIEAFWNVVNWKNVESRF